MTFRALGHYVSNHTRSRINPLTNAMAVVSGDDDRITVRVDGADDTDMRTTTPRKDSDRSNLGSRDATTIVTERHREVGTRSVIASTLQDEVHEACAPQVRLAGRVGANPAARLTDKR